MWNGFPGEYVEALLTDTLVRSRRLYKTPFYSTPIQTLYFYIPVSGQPQLWTPFSRPVSAYKSFHRTRSLYWPIRGGPVQFCERVEISLVEVYERGGKSVISVSEKAQNACILWLSKCREQKTFWFWFLFSFWFYLFIYLFIFI